MAIHINTKMEEALPPRTFGRGLRANKVMKQVDARRYVAFSLCFAFILLSFAGSSWQMHLVRSHTELVQGSRAAQVASQLAAILEAPEWTFDIPSARRIVFTTMQDPELYAVKVTRGDALLEGQRRGENGELNPWDGELIEKTVQAINPIEREGKKVGAVEVYLRLGQTLKLVHDTSVQEMLRFFISLFFALVCLLLYLRSNGDLAHLPSLFSSLGQGLKRRLRREAKGEAEPVQHPSAREGSHAVDLEAGRLFQHADPGASGVTAGFFRHAFDSAPAIMPRLLAEKKMDELAHLGHLLAVSAPCVGAFALQKAAENMCSALSSSGELCSSEVENCIYALEHVLAALKAQN